MSSNNSTGTKDYTANRLNQQSKISYFIYLQVNT